MSEIKDLLEDIKNIKRIREGDRLKYTYLALFASGRYGKIKVFLPEEKVEVEVDVEFFENNFFLVYPDRTKEKVIFIGHYGGYTKRMVKKENP